MSRINTNVSSLIAQNNLARTNRDLETSLQRLSTGLQINRGADNPAGLIVSERLRSEIQGATQAIDNAERATNVIATTEGALQEISTLLTQIKALTIEAANTGAFSPEEIEANQLEIDSAVESITRISNTTSFAGLKLLNGSLDYLDSGVVTSQISDINVFGANFGLDDNINVQVEVINSAEKGTLFLSGNTAGAPGALLSSVSFELQGSRGVQVFNFASGTALSAVAAAVNNVRDATGVTARLASATNQTSGLLFESEGYGTSSFVSVRKLDDGDFFDTFDAQGGSQINRDEGADVLSLVNGNLALGDGLDITLNTNTINLGLTLTSGAAQVTGTPYSFTVTGGGANFQIGPQVNSLQQVGFGIQSVAASNLGDTASGFLNSISTGGDNSLVAGKTREASEIIDKSIDQIAQLRGRLGAFERNTLQTAVRSTAITLENLTASESSIRDTDFAQQTAELTRAQILQQAGTSTLGIANSNAQNVLSLLG
ncbi:flagellin N-terminal helical domain-containing protein [Algisphaera agarilytica]|uniref:Flagellin n=1 Tax=Algisphaera agarilytica TaxID=1385975 RepID=A0A7X0H759_9BACT|nr:flagellin [Algisphaera agarilytica]MBB6430363.1 flagellin [Algisphaera agarilytica]